MGSDEFGLVSVLGGGRDVRRPGRGRGRQVAGGRQAWWPLEPLEGRMLLDGSWDLLSDVMMTRGVDYEPGGARGYSFRLGFDVEAGSGLETAALLTPGGQRLDITDHEDLGDVEEWELEIESSTLAGLSAFTAGLYTLELDFGAGPETTELLFGMPGTGDPLPAVSQRPVFTSPTHAQAMDGQDLTAIWQPVTDAAVNTIVLNVESQDGTEVVEETFADPSTTTFGPTALPADTLYECSLAFAHVETNTSAEGLDYMVATWTHSFVVINTYTQLNPELVVDITATTLPETMVPGDRGTVTVVVTNYGRAAAVGTVSFEAYADSGGDGMYIGGADDRRVSLGVGRSATYRLNVQVPPDAPAGTYWLSVTAFPTLSADEIDPLNNTDWSDETRDVVWQFGAFAGRRNVGLTVLDSFGATATFRMSGPGFGTVSDSGNGLQVDLTDTTGRSTVRVGRTSREEYPCLADVTAPGSLTALLAPYANLSGSLNVPAGLRTLSLHDALDGAAITLGPPENASWSARMTLHEAAGLTILSEMAINSLTAALFNGTITCPRLGAARTTAGDFSAEMDIGPGGVGSIRVYKGDLGGSLDSEGPVGNLTVTGAAVFDTEAQEGAVVGGNLLCSPITTGAPVGRGKSLGNVTLTAGSFGTSDTAVEVTAAGDVGNFRVKSLRYKLNVEEVEVLDSWGEPRTDSEGNPITRRVTHYSRQGGGIWADLETPGRLGSLTTAGGDLGSEIHAAGGMGRISLQALLLGNRTSWLGIACTNGEVLAANLTAALTAEPGAGAVAIPSISVFGGDVTGSIVLDGKLGPVTVSACAQRLEEEVPTMMGGGLSSETFQASAIGNISLLGGAFAVSAESATRIGNLSVVGGEMDGGLKARDAIGNVTLRALTANARYRKHWVSEEGEGWWEFECTEGAVVGFASAAALAIDLGGPVEDYNPQATLGLFTVTAAALTANGTIPFDPTDVRSVTRDRTYAESYEMDEETNRVTRNDALAEGVFTNNLLQA